ncbi:hypothetical protein [Vitiosangium sp. GDMCC 1.1324]|uniref:hypothetical protein n=1 Tax=Vitiosangium sp. (strain GDMCC 1.1324) TaxID=2138576 RepID=UPI000D3485B0|nr:hypothetical protein [Vitiosangium sp. GDMCC 1.1324]PTL79709.1 hypothetical protein DAT35_33465 [Vitiosangium sp. GDMCC 1.1324]
MAEQVSSEQMRKEIPGWGVDADPRNRPGVPMILKPQVREGAHWEVPERQPPPPYPVLKRVELKELTPTFGTGVPPRGLSGVLRRVAYDIPEHLVRHILLLLLADRVDVVESRVRRQPVTSLGALLGLVGGGLWLGRRLRA